MEENLQEKWVTEEVCCLNCGHQWVAVHPDAKLLECSSCGFMNNSNRHSPPPFHMVISRVNDATYLKPSRPISRVHLIGFLTEAIGMLTSSDRVIMRPQDCSLNIVVSHFGEEEA